MATKYLNNKDMLKQIHLSKATYCEYITDEGIVLRLNNGKLLDTPLSIEEASKRISRL